MRTYLILIWLLLGTLEFGSTLQPKGSRKPSISSTSSVENLPGSPDSRPASPDSRPPSPQPQPQPQTPSSQQAKTPLVDKTSISEIRKKPGKPPVIVDTTGSHYNNDWPKPDEASNGKKAIKTPQGTRPSTPADGQSSSKARPPPIAPKTPIKDSKPPNTWKTPSTPKQADPKGAQAPPSAPKKPSSYNIPATQPVPPTPNQQKVQAEEKAKQDAATDKAETKRKGEIQAVLNSQRSGPTRPDSDWEVPKADARQVLKSGKPGKPVYKTPFETNGRTPYHPNTKSSGRIDTPPRDHQYSGRPGSPRNDPGFHEYSSNDPFDRSYVRVDHFKGRDGQEKVAATGIYDASSSPYHAANKLNRLKKRPDFTYAETSKDNEENRKVTGKVHRTEDDKRQNYKGKPQANPKDEFPFAGTEVKGPDGKNLKKDARYDQINVSPVPFRESVAEGTLRRKTKELAEKVTRQQNIQNLKDGKPTQEVMLGVGVMNGHLLKYDYGDGKKGPYNLPSPQGSLSPPSSGSPPSSPSRPAPPLSPGPSNPRPARAQSLTPSDIERFQKLQLDFSDEEQYPSLPKPSSPQLSSPSSPEPAGLSKKEGKKPKKDKRSLDSNLESDPDQNLEVVFRRWLRRRDVEMKRRRREVIERRQESLRRRALITQELLRQLVASA